MTAVVRTDLIAMASFGGHLEELLALREAWAGLSCLYVTTRAAAAPDPSLLPATPAEVVTDCHRSDPGGAYACMVEVIGIVRRHRPRCVVTTGALPGLIMAVVARAAGARVIWIDSLANADELSGSGRLARWIAHGHLSQWPEVARRGRSRYAGSLL